MARGKLNFMNLHIIIHQILLYIIMQAMVFLLSKLLSIDRRAAKSIYDNHDNNKLRTLIIKKLAN